MKVLHVIQTLSPRHGGPATSLRTLAREQALAGLHVSICATTDSSQAGSAETISNGPIKEDKVTIYFHKPYFKPLLFSNKLASWLKNEISGFNIVHIHGLYRFPVTYAAWCAQKKGVPYLISPHGSMDPFLYRQSRYGIAALPLKRLYERFFDIPNLNNASAVHYTAKDEAERASFLKLRARAVIVPNGINWNSYEHLPATGFLRRNLGLDAMTPLILFLGRINFAKGLNLLVPAFAQVLRKLPQARLAIVGPDNEGYAARVKRWCRKQDIEKKVFFVDPLEAEEVQKAYVDADVFVLPSYTENFGMAVVEAMACACPVIISNQVNTWREIKDAGAGIVVELDPERIAQAICRILQNHKEAKAMGVQGRRAAKELYSLPQVIKKFTRVYEEIIEEAAAKRRAGK
jgi:glycosyltransferase involved in cell wall biosynthesis